MKTIKWGAFFTAVLISLSAQAQTYYITDKVLVGVYEKATAESKLLTTLPSGTPLEVIELSDEQIAALMAFMEALTSPAAMDLKHIIPEAVPSGLAVGGE